MADPPDEGVHPYPESNDEDPPPDTPQGPQSEDEFNDIVRFLTTHDRCSASRVDGERCGQPVSVQGATVCRLHGGASPQVLKAAVERLRIVRDVSIERLDQVLTEKGDKLDPRVLLDIVTRLTDKVELLEGRATSRTETHEFKLDEARVVFERRLTALSDSYQRAPMVLDMIDTMMGEDDPPALPEEAESV